MDKENSKKIRRSEKAGIANFSKEMISALLMAFVFIVYVIQAFKIPTGSMENSLLAGDFLLGLKFVYGAPVLPFSYAKLPAVMKPKAGDVVIFKYPGKDAKDYIKRCVAGPGQTIEIQQEKVYLDDKLLKLPPAGKYTKLGLLSEGIHDFKKLRIPAKGDTLYPESMPIREFLFCKHLIHQENPEKSFAARVQNTPFFRTIFPYKFDKERTTMKFAFFVNGELYKNNSFEFLDKFDNWLYLDQQIEQIKMQLKQVNTAPGSSNDSLQSTPHIEVKKAIYLDGKRVTKYIVKKDNYFMVGDNRDNSLDSRYWGYLNRNFVKAKAFIIYFSWAKYYEEFKTREEITFAPQKMQYPDNGRNVNSHDSKKRLLWAINRFISNRDNEKYYWDANGDLVVGEARIAPFLAFHKKIRWNRLGKLIRKWEKFEE